MSRKCGSIEPLSHRELNSMPPVFLDESTKTKVILVKRGECIYWETDKLVPRDKVM
jgi:hypothetical protein